MRALTLLGLLALSLAGGDVLAAPECSSTPSTGNHIECEEGSTSTDDIDIDAEGVDIDLAGGNALNGGVQANHRGTANVDITLSGQTTGGATTPTTIDTTGQNSMGVLGRREAATSMRGVWAWHWMRTGATNTTTMPPAWSPARTMTWTSFRTRWGG